MLRKYLFKKIISLIFLLYNKLITSEITKTEIFLEIKMFQCVKAAKDWNKFLDGVQLKVIINID